MDFELNTKLAGKVHISIICVNHLVQECVIHLIIEVIEVVGKMKEKEGLRDLGQQSMKEEIKRKKNNREDNMEGENLKILNFQMKCDSKAYIEWEMKVKQIFACHEYSEEKKIMLATMGFDDKALTWSKLEENARERIRKPKIATWKEIKEFIRKIFLPPYYEKYVYDRLQNLTKGSKSLEEYHKEMIMTIRKANVQEPKTSITRFLCGLNKDIRCIVKLQHYKSLEDMVHQAKKVERRLERKHSYKKTYHHDSSRGKDKSKK